MILYIQYLKAYFMSISQYKKSAILTIIGQFLTSLFSLLGINFLFSQFNSLGGFTYEEILLCYSNITFAFSLAEFFARGFDTFPYLISDGRFDRILLRPRGAILQILGATFEISRLGRLFQAILIYIWVLPRSKIVWNFFNIFVLLEIQICGFVLFVSLFILYATICFFTTQGLEIFNIFTDGSREFGKYPFAVYGDKVLKIFTYVVPVACIQYYPISYLTGKTGNMLYAFTPLFVIPYTVLVVIFWKIGVKKYTSTGS
ncbi:hypothetical protein B5F07_18020 [Lachnoclostridium sp. An169]|uniref:ABC transporter permease n=1 Tax=Lachnoclostridium sp. An169 TaxID=1965569 RepID=UPI000B38640C|nr:ABC-2 family transporter protein [Lachnoclostridium sp. An169]OUP81254.1 hypothetical protein B5F07_18020 [Lachnoclostridium sp. An169]